MAERASPSPALLARLRESPLFAALGEAEFTAVQAELEWLRLDGGEVLFEQGAPGDSLYVLLHGRLLVTVGAAGEPARVINVVRPGETVGELAVLTDAPRSAGVRAHRDALLCRLSRERFGQLVQHTPGAVLGLSRVVVERLVRRSGPTEPAPETGVFAVVGVDGEAPTRVAEWLARVPRPVAPVKPGEPGAGDRP